MDMFDREKDLVEAFSRNTKKILKEILNKSIARHFVIEEFDSYHGVADLVVGTYKPYLSKKKLRAPINRNWIYPLTTFNCDEIINKDEFQKKFGLTKSSASLRLNEYCEANFLRKINRELFVVINEYEYVTDNVVAVEAKLKNWKRALLQAQRYKKFSDYSFVVLDESHSNSAISNLIEFQNSKIGLITMKDSQYRIHYIPEKQYTKKDDYFVRLNETAYNYFATQITF